MAKKAAKKQPMPYSKIAEMWKAGKNYEQIAKAIGRYDEGKADPTKRTRAAVSNMLRLGYTNQATGKTVKLARRKGMKTTAVKPAKKTTKKVAVPAAEGGK